MLLKLFHQWNLLALRPPSRLIHQTSSALLHFQNEIANVPTSQTRTPNHLLNSIQSASNSYELFEIVSLKRKEFTADHVMQSLRTLFALQKNKHTAVQPAHILKNQDFDHLCRNVKSKVRMLDLNNVIETLKILLYLGVPPNSEIAHLLLNRIRCQINDISLGHIIFLEFLLKQVDSTPLVEALRIALPMLLDIQLDQQMDYENTGQLIDLLYFVAKNQVSDKSMMNVISALTLHGEDITCEEARRILSGLVEFKEPNENSLKLLENCMKVFEKSIDQLPFDMVETTLARIIDKYAQKNPMFYNETFFNRCIQYVIENNVGFVNGIYVQRKLNKISYISLPLLDYLSEKIANKAELLTEAKPIAIFTYVAAISTANYKPMYWESIKPLFAKNSLLQSDFNELPWIKFTLELLSIDVYNSNLIGRIFSNTFLEKYLRQDNKFLDHMQLLLLFQSVKIFYPEYDGPTLDEQYKNRAIELKLAKNECPLTDVVHYCFGGREFVYSRVRTRLGHFIDHVIVFDENGDVVKCNQNAQQLGDFYEDLPIKTNEKAVAIITMPKTHYGINIPRLKGMFDLQIRSLEAIDIPVACINLHTWTQLPDSEKLLFIERETKYKLL